MDDGDEFNRRFLIQVLEFLAADSEAQVDKFPESKDVPELLTVLWHDSFEEKREEFENGLVTTSELDGLNALDGVFGRICAPGRTDVWTNAALEQTPDWEEVRRIARDLLQSMNAPASARSPEPP